MLSIDRGQPRIRVSAKMRGVRKQIVRAESSHTTIAIASRGGAMKSFTTALIETKDEESALASSVAICPQQGNWIVVWTIGVGVCWDTPETLTANRHVNPRENS